MGSAVPRHIVTNPGDWGRHAAERTSAGVMWSTFAPSRWRVRWRLAAIVVVPAVIAACLGGITIDRDASDWLATDRVQNLAQPNMSVVRLVHALEDERDLSLGYAANRVAVPDLAAKLRLAQQASASAGQAVQAGAARIGTGGGLPGDDRAGPRHALAGADEPAARPPGDVVLVVEADSVGLGQRPSRTPTRPFRRPTRSAPRSATAPATRTSTATKTLSAHCCGCRTRCPSSAASCSLRSAPRPPRSAPPTWPRCCRPSSSRPRTRPNSTASASQAELANFSRVTAGSASGPARTEEALALTNAFSDVPLTSLNNVSNPKLTAPGWYDAMSATINGTHQVQDQLVGMLVTQASALRSQATSGLAGHQRSHRCPPGLGGADHDRRGPVLDPSAAQAALRRARRGQPPAARDGGPAQRERGRSRERRDRADRCRLGRRDRRSRASLRPGAPRGGPAGRPRGQAARQPERDVRQPVPPQSDARRTAARHHRRP